MSDQLMVAVWGLTQVIKSAGMPSKYLPVCAIVLGATINVAPNWGSIVIIDDVIEGLFIGLIASGIIGMVDGRLTKLNDTKSNKT